jgi:hypothetical protein
MDDITIEKELDFLKEQHRDIDIKINDLIDSPFQDQLRMMRLKKEKLQLKDQIVALESEIYPDIIA